MSFSPSGVTGQFALIRVLQDLPPDQSDPTSQSGPDGNSAGSPNVRPAGGSHISPDVLGLLFEFSVNGSQAAGGSIASADPGTSTVTPPSAPPASGAASSPTQDGSGASSADPVSDILQELNSLISAVSSGNASDTQDAFNALEQIAQSASVPGQLSHHHHHHGARGPQAVNGSEDAGSGFSADGASAFPVTASITSSGIGDAAQS